MNSEHFSVCAQDNESEELPIARRAPPQDAEAWVANWLREYIAKVFHMSTNDVDPDQTFGRFGLDSLSALELAGDLSELLDCKMADALVAEHPTIHELSRYLGSRPDVKHAFVSRLSHKDTASLALQTR